MDDDDGAMMDGDARYAWNRRLVGSIVQMMNHRMSLTTKLHAYMARTFLNIQIMTWVAYGAGVFLTVTSVVFFITTAQRLEALGITALGVAELVAVFVYHPIRRMQKALGDFSEHTVLLHGWNVQVALKMLHMNINDKASVDETCKYIQEITRGFATAVEEVAEAVVPPART